MVNGIEIIDFIDALRESDGYIEMIYSFGSCYKFHLLLKKLFPECEPYIGELRGHVISEYKGKFYDITGEVSPDEFYPMNEDDVLEASEWSFHKYNYLQITECPNCDEPILFKN